MSSNVVVQDGVVALRRTMRKINWVAEKCAGIFLVGMVAAVTISVVARLLYTYAGIAVSVTWAEELARYLMVGAVFIGGAVAAYEHRLIGVDAIQSLVSAGMARWLRLAGHLLTLVLGCLLVWKSGRLIELGLKQWSPAMEIPMAYVYSLMIVGCILLSANALTHVVTEALGIAPDGEATAPEAMDVGPLGTEHLS